jgi:site-specific DNA-methyltransferase (adenine-specific)
VYSDVIRVAAESRKEHAAQKPVSLYVDLLRRSILPGDTVLDPFAGSGTVFPAAKEVACKAIGFELDPASYAIGLGRIS